MGAFLVVLFSFLSPKIKQRWQDRGGGGGGRGYVGGVEEGIEVPATGNDSTVI